MASTKCRGSLGCLWVCTRVHKCISHGESISSRNNPDHNKEGSNMRDNIVGLLYDTFRDVASNLGVEGVREGLSEDQ